MCPFYPKFLHSLERLFAAAFFINTLFHFGRYIFIRCTTTPVTVTQPQRKLLGLSVNDMYFKDAESTPKKADKTALDSTFTPINLSKNSWISQSKSFSPYSTLNSTSQSRQNLSFTPSPATLPKSIGHSTPICSPSSNLISDQSELTRYLKSYDLNNSFEADKSSKLEMTSPNLLSSFWYRQKNKETSLIKRFVYQLAPATSLPTSGNTASDDVGSARNRNDDVWDLYNVDLTSVIQWTANLRMWLSQTILERLVKEIDAVNSALHAQGLSDITIGHIGIDRLKKTASSLAIVQSIPSLSNLVMFLDISPNQEYVVSRIKELAKGGCISEYSWNSGGKFQGKDWDSHLPSDANLMMSLLAAYFDSQLPPMSLIEPGAQPFTSTYFVQTPSKVDNKMKDSFFIYQDSIHPPNFQFCVGSDKYEVSKGRNNFFHTVLLFLLHVKVKEHGMLGRINLGRSGLNMLWVIDS